MRNISSTLSSTEGLTTFTINEILVLMNKNYSHKSHSHPGYSRNSLHSPKFYLIITIIVAFSVLGISKVIEFTSGRVIRPQKCLQDILRCSDGKEVRRSGPDCAFPRCAFVDSNGISGKILLSPTCPGPQKTGESCIKPYQATVFIRSKDGAKEITHFISDKEGQFKVELPVGDYLLEPTATGSAQFPHASPQLVHVEKNKYTEIIIGYDTGIR